MSLWSQVPQHGLHFPLHHGSLDLVLSCTWRPLIRTGRCEFVQVLIGIESASSMHMNFYALNTKFRAWFERYRRGFAEYLQDWIQPP